MQVNGKQVDAIQWLRDTGGKNAIKRFSPNQAPAAAAPEKTAISKQDAADLKNQLLLNKVSVVPGITTTAASSALSMLSQLKTAQTPVVAPQNTKPAAPNMNTINFNNAATNTATVNGGNNTVDFRSKTGVAQKNTVAITGNNNIVRGYNGGQTNNTITVGGDANRLYAGQNVSNTTANIKGAGTTVNLGENASNNTVAVTGNNVKVEIGTQGLSAGSNQGWNINIAANDVQVSIVNGKATVTMADDLKDKYKVTINDQTKSVNVVAV
jgi:hypothetical protein